MTTRSGHGNVCRPLAFACVVAKESKGGESLEEQEVPLGNGGRLRPPLFYAFF